MKIGFFKKWKKYTALTLIGIEIILKGILLAGQTYACAAEEEDWITILNKESGEADIALHNKDRIDEDTLNGYTLIGSYNFATETDSVYIKDGQIAVSLKIDGVAFLPGSFDASHIAIKDVLNHSHVLQPYDLKLGDVVFSEGHSIGAMAYMIREKTKYDYQAIAGLLDNSSYDTVDLLFQSVGSMININALDMLVDDSNTEVNIIETPSSARSRQDGVQYFKLVASADIKFGIDEVDQENITENPIRLKLVNCANKDDYYELNQLSDRLYDNAGLRASGGGIDLSSYRYVGVLQDIFDNYVDYRDKKIKEGNDDSAATVVFGEPPFSSAVKMYGWLIDNYLFEKTSGSSLEVEFDNASGWNLIDFPDVPSGAEGLSAEEKLRIQAYYYIESQLDSDNSRTLTDSNYMDKKQHDMSGLSWRYSEANPPGTSMEISEDGYEGNYIRAEAVKAIKETQSAGPVSSRNLSAIMQAADQVVKYQAALMYGFGLGNITSDDSFTEDETLITESKFLGSLLPGPDSGTWENLSYDMLGLPQMKNMRIVAGTNQAYDAYFKLQYLIILMQTYANRMMFLDGDGEYRDAEVETFLSMYGTSNINVDQDDIDDIREQVLAYTAMNDALVYLGVDLSFTPQLKAVSEYASKLISFKDVIGERDYDADMDEQPMAVFFSSKSGILSDDLKEGIALSATYVPLVTNMYEASSVSLTSDTSWVERFHYPFGFYRKALYIDTDTKAAVNRYITNQSATHTKIATLRDLMEPERDIVLYLDTKFYNIDVLADAQGVSYTALQNTVDAQEDNSGQNIGEWIADRIAGVAETDIEAICKTGGHAMYSENVKRKTTEYGSLNEKPNKYVLTDEKIKEYLTGYNEDQAMSVYDDYTPLQSYAVVSAIYKDNSLYNKIQKECKYNNPVFVSSPNLAGVVDAGEEQFNTLYNYAMLMNLKKSAGVDYKTSLDMDSPLYMDIYGNILTESGLVVIPSMSNATLLTVGRTYNVFTAGFVTLYNQGNYQIPKDYNNASKYTRSALTIDKNTGKYALGIEKVNSTYIDFAHLPASDENAMRVMKEIADDKMKTNRHLDSDKLMYVVTEVLRGAPLDNIDKMKEGLTGNTSISKAGIYIAYKLEEILNSFFDGFMNLVELPNIAFMEGFEYIVLFGYKVVFALLLVLACYRVYIDAAQGYLGIKTVVGLVTSMVMLIFISFAVPNLLDISYYQTNKRLLQEEVMRLELLTLEKQDEGCEIGITGVSAPESGSKLYLRVDDADVPWYSVLDDVLFNSTYATVSEIYEVSREDSILAHLPHFFTKGNGLYIDVNDMFEMVDVRYSPETNVLYTVTNEEPYASYVTPYYAVLDLMVARVNAYNEEHKIKDFNIKVRSGGNVKTSGMIQAYFMSEYFMSQSQDICGFKRVYLKDTTLKEVDPFTNADIAKMQYSMWYMGEEELNVEERIDDIDLKIRAFVVENKDLIGKVSDDTFLKVLALKAAVEYNKEFRVGAAEAVEIYDLDSRDVIRMSIANDAILVQDISKSFARVVYDNSGTLGIITASFLLVIHILASVIKPFLIYGIILVMIAAAVVRRMVKRDTEAAVEGVIITMAILCGVNMLYAVVLKASLMIPELGLSLPAACLVQIAIQIIYISVVFALAKIVFSDWQNVGMSLYQEIINSSIIRITTHSAKVGAQTLHIKSRGNIFNKGRNKNDSEHETPPKQSGDIYVDKLEQMRDNDRLKHEHKGNR